MTTASKKKKEYPVRQPTADDAIELFGILGAAGTDDSFSDAIGLTIFGYQQPNKQGLELAVRGGAKAVSAGLTAALRDPESRQAARQFIFSIWNPKLGVAEDDDEYEEKKRQAWKKLPMRAPLEIVDSFRKTEDFADFLSFFTDMMPTASSDSNSGGESTESNESTG